MKKILFASICFCIIMSKAGAQMRDTTLNPASYKVDSKSLFQKAKKQKTGAWILLGSGAALAITGMGIITSDASYNSSQDISSALTTIFTLGTVTPEPVHYRHHTAGTILAIAGAGAMLGSIPLFTASGKTKREARLLLKNETVFLNPQLSLTRLLSLGVRFNL